MPRGLNRTDLNTTDVDYLHGNPVVLPVTFGTPITLPHNFGNQPPFDPGNPVTWVPNPAHFGNIFGANLGGVVSLTLTPTQVKSLNTPVQIVPGKVGYIPLLESGYMVFTPGGSAYNVGANDTLELYVGNGTSSGSLINYTGVLASGFIDAFDPHAAIVFFNPSYMSETPSFPAKASVLTSNLSGSGLYLVQYNSVDTFPTGTNWTGGTGTLKIVIEYDYIEA